MDVIDAMTRVLQGLGILLLVGGLAYHFAALRMFNALVPKDAGVRVLAMDVPYGTHPQQNYDVYAPEAANGLLPVLIFVHGGSWDSGRRKDYDFVARAFAARGYLVILPGYRFAPEHVYPDFVADIASAIAAVHRSAQSYGGDGSRIFAVGHSAGGYNVLQAILDPQFLAASGVDPKIIKGVATLAAPADFLPLDSPKTIAAFGKADPLESTQPVKFARKDAPPILLLHGSADKTVYPRNSRNLYQKLKDARANVHYTEYPGISHVAIMLALAKPFRHRAPSLDDIDAFFKAQR
jgi:acetyl esterase/lipase